MNLVMEMGLTGTTVPAVTPLMTFRSLAASQPLALCCPRSEGHDMSPRKPAPRAGAGRGGAELAGPRDSRQHRSPPRSQRESCQPAGLPTAES